MPEKMNDVKQMNYNALMVLQCLFENSDQYRHLSLKEIEKTINKKYGYGPTHNTINKILHYLPDYGFDVRKGTRANPGFYLNSRFFTNGEVLFLIESLKKTRSMSAEDKQQFIDKLNEYLGPEFADVNQRDFLKTKKKDKDLVEKIEIIYEAIKKDRQLWFSVPDEYLVVKGDMAIARELAAKNGMPFEEPVLRIQSNPYKVFMRDGKVYLLYSAQTEKGRYPLMQREVSELSVLWIDPDYEIVPIYRVDDYEMVDDELLDKTDGLYPTGNKNLIYKVRLGDNDEKNKHARNLVVMQRGRIREKFKDNVEFVEEDGVPYAIIKDIYGEAKEFFFRHVRYGCVVSPPSAVKQIRRSVAAMHNAYFPEKEQIPEAYELRRYLEEALGEGHTIEIKHKKETEKK